MGQLTDQARIALAAAKDKDRLLAEVVRTYRRAAKTRTAADICARRAAIRAAHDRGCSYNEIGQALGMSKQGAMSLSR